MKQCFKRLLAVCILFCGSGSGASDEGGDVCRAAQRFAVDAAERMRSGVSANQEFDSHGGLDALSKPLLNIINYVHSHRVNANVQPARIGALTLAKCENGSFGALSYADLPEIYDPAYQRRNEDVEPDGHVLPAVPPDVRQGGGLENPGDPGNGAPDAQCRMYKQRIKEIDDRMRGGYSSETGESAREERRRYRELINRHCS